jgi:hypothetical protein
MPHPHRSLWRDNGLSLVLLVCFIVFLAGQALTGWKEYNHNQLEHEQPETSLVEYLGTGHFLESVAENWESEFLQMGAFVLLATVLYQRGSSESKDPDDHEEVDEPAEAHRNDLDAPWPVRAGGVWLHLYSHSLSIAFLLLFAASFLLHASSGLREYNAEQAEHGDAAVTFAQYLAGSRFWFESFQNWQSEFLAIWCMVAFSIFLRQRGSPQSKPVHAPHAMTGAS